MMGECPHFTLDDVIIMIFSVRYYWIRNGYRIPDIENRKEYVIRNRVERIKQNHILKKLAVIKNNIKAKSNEQKTDI